MAAGLPKTCQQVGTILLPSFQGWPRGLQHLFYYSICLISLCSFTHPEQLYSFSTPPLATVEIAIRIPSGVNIICFGDSLTQGVGASRGHDYPSLLSQAMGTAVINAGADGDETSDALKRLESDVLFKDPRMVIVELGANDFLDGQPLEQAFENLDQIVRRIEERGAMVVLVGVAPGPLGDALQPYYNAIINKYHVVFVPKVLDEIVTNPSLLSSDYLHPNDQGYKLIAERIQRVVNPLLYRPKAFRKPRSSSEARLGPVSSQAKRT